MSKFNVDKFDKNVCIITYNIHRKIRTEQQDKMFANWCDDNRVHLEELYSLSELECDLNTFCNYVFTNSDM